MTLTDVSPRGAAALLYAAVFGPVLALHTPDEHGVCDCPKRDKCDKPGKHPRTLHGLDDATTDEATIRRWWTMWPQANIGLDLARSGLVDIAPDSLEWHAEFIARGLPPTLTFASGGGDGHRHYLYARPAGCATYRQCETGKYDLLSGGYAVMPLSLHQSGREYTWIDPPDGTPIAAPQTPAPRWAVDMLNAHRRPQSASSAIDSDPGAPPVALRGEPFQRWRGEIYDTRGDGHTVDRSRSLWWIAVGLLDAGCKPWFVAEQLAERDAALGWTKFSDRRDARTRYRVIVERAMASRGPGPARVKSARAPAPPPGPFDWLTAISLDDLEDETVRWFLLGLLGAGLVLELDGKAKQAGKTTLILAMIRAILNREEFLGLATAYTPVLYLTEQSGPSFKRNLARAGLLDREDLHILLWNRAVGRKWADIVAEARAKAKQVGAGLLVIDTLAQFSGIRGEDENKSGAAMETMEPVQAASADGLAILLSRHDRKSGGEVGDSGRGSSAFAGAVDIVVHLQRLPGDRTGREKQRLLDGISRFEETPDQLLIELEPGEDGEPYSFRAIGDVAEVRKAKLQMEIAANLGPDRDMALSVDDLRDLLGVRKQDLVQALWLLMKDRTVIRIGEGKSGAPYRYYLPPREADDAD